MTIQDQIGRTFYITQTPKTIVCLVPSITELLCDLGLEDHIVGITKFCVHPQGLRKSKEIIGGTKSVHIDKIKTLSPEIVIANKEENTLDCIQQLEQFTTVFVSQVAELEDCYQLIQQLGRLFSKEKDAIRLIEKLRTEHQILLESIKGKRIAKVAYLIWKNPYMVAGGDTFISQMLCAGGYENYFKNDTRYPEISLEAMKDTEFVFLSSEPFPFTLSHKEEIQNTLPKAKVILVNGEYFSWYGSRLLKAFPYLRDLRLRLDKLA